MTTPPKGKCDNKNHSGAFNAASEKQSIDTAPINTTVRNTVKTAPPKENHNNKKTAGAVGTAPEKQTTGTAPIKTSKAAPPKEKHNNKNNPVQLILRKNKKIRNCQVQRHIKVVVVWSAQVFGATRGQQVRCD
jgi:hypothetical protein